MRILVGTVEIAGLLLDYADGFRQAGHDVTSVVCARNPFYPVHQYDVDLNSALPWPRPIAQALFPLIRFPRGGLNRIYAAGRLMSLISQHDVFVFQWAGVSLTENNREYRLLKALGKRIVSIFMGSDVRHVPSFVAQYKASELSQGFVEELSRRMNNTLKPLRAIRTAERFSDLILSQPNQSNLAIRPYMHCYLPMRLARYQFLIPERDIPVVVHAPSSQDVKGTERILAQLEQLKKDGVRFELRMIHGVSNEQVIEALEDADVVVDQLYSGGYGKLSMEAMASGCAVATRSYDVFWDLLPGQPTWHIESSNLYPQLKRLLTEKDLRVRLANEGRRYVEAHHDHVNVARRILSLLETRIESYDYYPTFFARHFNLREGEVIPAQLKSHTASLIQQWGLPEGVSRQDMVARGLIPANY